MSARATTACNSDGQTDEDLKHEEYLSLQDHMSHPIAFHAEMVGDIMYSGLHEKKGCHRNFNSYVGSIRSVAKNFCSAALSTATQPW
jgi:hypothetical protein